MKHLHIPHLGLLAVLVSVGCAQSPGEDGARDDSAGDDTEHLEAVEQSLSSCASPSGALIPTMTGNTSPSGLVTRSGVYSASNEAWQAFDNTTATLWLSNMNTSSVWIGYEWGGATQVVSSYELKYANGSCCEQRGPKNWTLQGWNGSTWVIVDTVTNQSGWYASPSRTYSVDSPGAYSKYRLNITADNYNNPTYPITLVSIASIQLYGAVSAPQIPVMSSNTLPSGSVSRSGAYSASDEAWQVFDNTTATLWLSNMYTSSAWVGYAWGGSAGKVITSYEIKYANGSCCEQRGPKNWILQGWNGASWVTVDTVTNQSGWYSTPSRAFIVDSPGCYEQYRLNVTADNYNDPSYPITMVSIATLQLYGY
jgi:archaellum component FlaF (FlaF/FlaG flagellin family)